MKTEDLISDEIVAAAELGYDDEIKNVGGSFCTSYGVRAALKGAIEALSAAGFVVVPIEPTPEQLSVGEAAYSLTAITQILFQDRTEAFRIIYRQMIGASQ